MKFFCRISINYAIAVWPRMPKFGTVTRVVEKRASKMSAISPSQGAGPQPTRRVTGRFGWLYWQANMDIESVTDPYAYMMYIVSPLAGLGGGILWRPPAYSLLGSRGQ